MMNREQFEQNSARLFAYAVTRCPKELHLPHAKCAFACDHVAEQDQDKPDGIVLMPAKYYLCFKCLQLMESHRFNRWNEIKVCCRPCVEETIARIIATHPTLFRDLSSGNVL